MRKILFLLSLIAVCTHAQNVNRTDIYGLADKHFVELHNGSFMGMMNDSEELIIPFERGYSFIDLDKKMQIHMFIVFKNKKWGICDENGHEVLPPIYQYISRERTGGGHPYLVAQMKKHEWYIYDIQGNKLSDMIKEKPLYDPVPGKGFYLWEKKKANYLNLVIETPEEYKLMARTRGNTIENGEQIVWYYIDRGRAHGLLDEKGDTLISPSRGYSKIKHNRHLYFDVYKGLKKGLCHMDGTEIVPPEYDYVFTWITEGGNSYIEASNKKKETVVYDYNGNIIAGPAIYISRESISALLDTPEEIAEARRRREAKQQTESDEVTATKPSSTLLDDILKTLNSLNGHSQQTSNDDSANMVEVHRSARTSGTSKTVEQPKQKQIDFAGYRMLDRAYSGYEDQLVKMRVYPEKFEKRDFEEIPSIQRKMREIRERIEKYGFKRAKSTYETWVPEIIK